MEYIRSPVGSRLANTERSRSWAAWHRHRCDLDDTRRAPCRLAPWLPWRMRPDRTCRSSSRVVKAARTSRNGGDGARIVEIVDLYGKSASRHGSPMCRKTQPNQPLAPHRRRRFYLAVRWSGSWPSALQPSNARHSPPARDQVRPASWLPISMRNADKQTRRLRREPGPILRWTVGRSLARTRIG